MGASVDRLKVGKHRLRFTIPRVCQIEREPAHLEHVPMRSTQFVGWAKAAKTSPHRRGARSAVPTRTGLTSCTLWQRQTAWARRTRRRASNEACIRAFTPVFDGLWPPLPSAPRRRLLPVEEDSTSIVNRLIE